MEHEAKKEPWFLQHRKAPSLRGFCESVKGSSKGSRVSEFQKHFLVRFWSFARVLEG